MDDGPGVFVHDIRRRRFGWFILGSLLGFAADATVIAGIVFLKARDTSVNPWETFAIAALGAAVCIAPVLLIVSGALLAIRRIRALSFGLLVASALGGIILLLLAIWGNAQADAYARLSHLA